MSKLIFNNFKLTALIILLAVIFFIIGFFTNNYLVSINQNFATPFIKENKPKEKPLLKYTFTNLKKYDYKKSEIKIEKTLETTENYTSHIFSFNTVNKKMTGMINLPKQYNGKTILMIRGYVPPELYQTGMGTKNAANYFATQGYITIAPDFFGYGESDPEPTDSWQARFEKPINIIELIQSIENLTFDYQENSKYTISQDKIGIWAHSNGGQIALSSLIILEKNIPTSLWAPVTAPFPYSVLYFGDEVEDEGKAQRKWISLFEEDYDVFEFSHTKHLDKINATIQIQHGNNDDAALIYWSKEFIDKIKLENKKRKNSTDSASLKEPININLIEYDDTNHNMVPNWNNAVKKDLEFFENNL